MTVTITRDEAAQILREVEANLCADLYKSRFDEAHAAIIVPRLIACLGLQDTDILRRALSGLHTIGPLAAASIDFVTKLMFHCDTIVAQNATLTLAAVAWRCPERATKPLVHAASIPELQKPALFSLISFGKAAIFATEVFTTAFESRDARMRRLALRGLKEIGAAPNAMQPLLERAQNDSNKQVRAAAERFILSAKSNRLATNPHA